MSTSDLTTENNSKSSDQPARRTGRQILRAGVLAIAVAIVANLVVRALIMAVVELPENFPPLQPGSIIFFTVIGVAAATLVFALVNRFARNPVRVFRIVAVIALVLSLIPNLSLMVNPANAPFPGGTPQAFAVLSIFHIVAAIVSIWILTMEPRR
jgi:predicted Co/Zn/Cd cation transporter (cation efflux family)